MECAAVCLCPLSDTATPLPPLTPVPPGCAVTATRVVHLPPRQAEQAGLLLSARSISPTCYCLFVSPCISSIKVPALAKLTFCCFSRRPLLLLSQNVSAVSRKCVCTRAVDRSVSVIQSSTEGLEEGSQLLDGSTPAVNYQIRARSSSHSAHLWHGSRSLYC